MSIRFDIDPSWLDPMPISRRSDAARCLHGAVVRPGAVDPIRLRPRADAARSGARSVSTQLHDPMLSEF
eukprot:6983463-Pyramimonas_sp.AAC.1